MEGPIELDKKKLDMMKRYAHSFEEDSFLLELDFSPDPTAMDLSAGGRALPAKVRQLLQERSIDQYRREDSTYLIYLSTYACRSSPPPISSSLPPS